MMELLLNFAFNILQPAPLQLGDAKRVCIESKREAEHSQQDCVAFEVTQRERRNIRKAGRCRLTPGFPQLTPRLLSGTFKR